MNTRVEGLLLFTRDTREVSIPAYEVERSSIFGIWSDAILGRTRAFLIGAMSFASAMMTPTKEYTILSEPTLKDVRLELNDAVRWNQENVPAGLRAELGSKTMRVIEMTVLGDDLVSITENGKTRTPNIRFSKTLVAQVVALADDGKLFIAPNYYFERVK